MGSPGYLLAWNFAFNIAALEMRHTVEMVALKSLLRLAYEVSDYCSLRIGTARQMTAFNDLVINQQPR